MTNEVDLIKQQRDEYKVQCDELLAALTKLHSVVIMQNRLGACWHQDVFPKLMSAISDADEAIAKAMGSNERSE